MAAEVKVSADLKELIDQLMKVAEVAKKTQDQLTGLGDQVSDTLGDNATKQKTIMENLLAYTRKAGSQMKNDFNALAKINFIQSGLKLNNMLRDGVQQAFALNDAINKFGPSLNIASSRFAAFQKELGLALAAKGISGDAGADALAGLRGTGVTGEKNIIEYVKAAASIASLSGESGQEGEIAKMLSDVLKNSGKDANSVEDMKKAAQEVTKAMDVTGQSASEILTTMSSVMSGMLSGNRGLLNFRGGAQVALAESLTGGADIKSLIESFTSKDKVAGQAFAKSMGLMRMFKNGELSPEGLRQIGESLKSSGVNSDFMANVLGQGQGQDLMELIESAQSRQLDAAFAKNAATSSDYEKKMLERRGITENVESSINTTIGSLVSVLAPLAQAISNLLAFLSKDLAGSAAVTVGAAGGAAALLASGASWAAGLLGGSGIAGGAAAATAAAAGATVLSPLAIGAAAVAAGLGGYSYLSQRETGTPEQIKKLSIPIPGETSTEKMLRELRLSRMQQASQSVSVDVNINNKAPMFNATQSPSRGSAR